MTWLKRGLSLALLAVVLYFFWPLLDELKAAAHLLVQARWGWLPLVVLVQVVSYGFLTWLNALALQPFGQKIGFMKLAAVLTSMAFIQIAIPSAGASGVALRVRLLGKFGYQAEESLFSLVVESLAEIVALAFVALIGVAYLLRHEHLSAQELLWFLLVAALLAALLAYFWKVVTDVERSRRMLVKWVSLWNPICARLPLHGRNLRLDPVDLEKRLATFQWNLRCYRQVPLWRVGLAAFGKVLLDVASLGAAFLLFGYLVAPGTLLTGYGLILTFSGVASLPAGLGVTDASVPVIFSLLEVPEPVALAAGLLYRLVAYWLVRFVGFFTWHYLEARF